jgi:hypothetical protein
MAELKTRYQVAVDVEIEIAGDETAAYTIVDDIMQRAWDTDDGRTWVKPKWHFEISGPGAVSNISQLTEVLREVVGDSCESHAEFEPGCPTCVAVSLLTVREVH